MEHMTARLLVVKKDSTMVDVLAVVKVAAWVGEWVHEMVGR